MYSFWSGILLDDHAYAGNPMIKHIALDKKFPLKKEHFEVWLRLFYATVDELFKGMKAEEAKSRAAIIAQITQRKISESRQGAQRQ
jgi:hemoglobin